MARRKSRQFITLGSMALIAAAISFAFWPRPVLVDTGTVTRGALIVTINQEARTRVHDAYIVSTPIAGRLLRVDVEPGDAVVRKEDIVAQMLPTNPAALDIRTREQARASVIAAEAALRVAQANHNKAIADKELSDRDYKRAATLASSGIASQAALDRAQSAARSAEASLDTTEAAIAMRIAEITNARARLIGFEDQGLAAAISNGNSNQIPLHAPATGRVLRVIQQSETILPAGAPIMEIGDIEHDLEIVVELLSTDAVQVSVGNRVIVDKWGGEKPLAGVVERIDPWGFTKFSALGVEEQRVNAVIRLTSPPEARTNLGHGFRVEARIVVWEQAEVIIVPSSALFRHGDDWAVYAVESGAAHLQPVKIDHNNSIEAQVVEGLEQGQIVILYPSSGLSEGQKVQQREYN